MLLTMLCYWSPTSARIQACPYGVRRGGGVWESFLAVDEVGVVGCEAAGCGRQAGLAPIP